MLSGGGAPATDPWAAPSSSFSSFNAFLEGGEAAPSPNFAVQPGGEWAQCSWHSGFFVWQAGSQHPAG